MQSDTVLCDMEREAVIKQGGGMLGNAQLSPILATARDILKEHKNKPMHISEIVDVAVNSARNQSMSSEDFATKLGAALAAHLKLKTQKPIFTKPLNKKGRPQKGIYRLKQEKGPPVIPPPPPPTISNNFIGKAGELAVMSELLFWGNNASMMTVDEGLDIVASKNNKYSHIQVKTSSEKINRTFAFQVTLKAFTTHDSAQTYYVFVMRKSPFSHFAVLPSNHLENLRITNVIGGAGKLSITITADEKWRRFSLNGSDITGWINNFGIINK